MKAQAKYALLAKQAEDMFDGTMKPAFSHPEWELLGYITGANALFALQTIGLGERVYYGFLAQSKLDPHQFAAVIRGTELRIEWLENIQGLLWPGPAKGLAEQGFWSIYATLQYEGLPILDAIPALLPPNSTVTVIGHSLGGALATYLMADLARPNNGLNVSGAIFASPRPGNEVFVHDVDSVVGKENYTSWAYLRDMVPHVPPSLPLPLGLSFQSLPNTTWITPSQSPVKIHNTLTCNHNAQTYASLIDPGLISPDSLPGTDPMKTAATLLFIFALLLILPGCTQIQAKLDSDIQKVAVPDVQAALDSAQAAGDLDGIACWSDWLAYVQSLPTTAASTSTPAVAGLASALQAARNASRAQPVSFPPIPYRLHKDCAVILLDANELAAKLGLSAASLGVLKKP